MAMMWAAIFCSPRFFLGRGDNPVFRVEAVVARFGLSLLKDLDPTAASDDAESRIRSSRPDHEKVALREEELRRRGAADGGGGPRKVVVEVELIDQPR